MTGLVEPSAQDAGSGCSCSRRPALQRACNESNAQSLEQDYTILTAACAAKNPLTCNACSFCHWPQGVHDKEGSSCGEQTIQAGCSKLQAATVLQQNAALVTIRRCCTAPVHQTCSQQSCSDAVQVLAEVLGAEAALGRIQFVSGTHAIATALYSVLRSGDELLAVAGRWALYSELPAACCFTLCSRACLLSTLPSQLAVAGGAAMHN